MRTDVQLADAETKLPNPDNPGLFMPAGVFSVDLSVPYWAQALADGSLVLAAAKTAVPQASKSATNEKDAR